MHLANAYYGHARILRRWAGAPEARPVAGMLQHGWNGGTGFTPHDPPAPVRRVLPCFVWNRDNLTRAWAAGYGAVTAVGAPFLYLARLDPLPEAPRGRGTLAYPFHAWEKESATGGSHGAYARQMAERDGAVTVCLYWLEYEDPAVRAAYEEAGHRVICHGYRDDPEFLDRQLAALRGHRRVVTNRVASALWYAAALGLEVELYGPRMGLKPADALEGVYEVHRRHWPELFEGPVAGEQARALALEQLGGEFLREPEELAELLGFRGRRRLFGALAPATRTLMRVKARLLK